MCEWGIICIHGVGSEISWFDVRLYIKARLATLLFENLRDKPLLYIHFINAFSTLNVDSKCFHSTDIITRELGAISNMSFANVNVRIACEGWVMN